MTQAAGQLVSFLFWSRASSALGWVFGMAVRAGIIIGIALVLLNPANLAYNPQARGQLNTQAQTLQATGQIAQADLWWQLLHSASVECHFKQAQSQEFLLSGTLPDEYIVPNSNAARWYVRFPTNLSFDLFGNSQFGAGVVTMQDFYGIVNSQGFKPCSAAQAIRARGLLGL